MSQQRTHSLNYTSMTEEGMGTRTPISFGTVLDQQVQKNMYDMTRVDAGSNAAYLYYLYRRPMGKGWFGFTLFQAARTRGEFNVEVGFGKRKVFPAYYSTYTPDYAIDGVRERLHLVLDSQTIDDEWWTYNSIHSLTVTLESVIRGMISGGMQNLVEKSRTKLIDRMKKWNEIVPGLQEQVGPMEVDAPDVKLPDDDNVLKCFNYIKAPGRSRKYGKLFPYFIRNLDMSDNFKVLHALVMKEILSDGKELEAAINGEVPKYEGDLLAILCGRRPWSNMLELPEDEEEAKMLYSYLKAYSVLESVLGREREQPEEDEGQ